ncbi:syrP protein [Ktedonobacter sp. SOSP1-85]|uniref:TauD/TfdA family dioxygenase n=1 Tax=Ktedonobacter sp. SOSP1-85 TaxID=2778367 RepID=UPI001915B9C7|nr:TauD/TfdA family dioxygenase [Ktedonobacter sp. SOSP1-85]GHO80007.1 syrP protein [Ktedonobacter sp. SOSP1-85]
MERKPSLKDSIRKNIREKREGINLADFNLTKASHLSEQEPLPLVVQPTTSGVNLASWAGNNREYIQNELAKYGAILFRDFTINSPAKFEEFALAASETGELFDEYGDLPRDDPGAKVYHSTPYPADKSILFHNESSHTHRWPMKIMFYCVKAAEGRGATPIIDCRKAYQELDPALIQRMTEKKLMYVRNFIDGLDVSWQQFFQTSDKQQVEEYCRKADIDFEWKSNKHLTTRQLCPAVLPHPRTGEMLFFNQIQLHHFSCLDPDVRNSMLSIFREEDLPRNVYYGDGSRIEDSVVAEISELYERIAVRFQWQAGDVIMLDNMRIAHARDPFDGTRKILVAMADIVYQKDVWK